MLTQHDTPAPDARRQVRRKIQLLCLGLAAIVLLPAAGLAQVNAPRQSSDHPGQTCPPPSPNALPIHVPELASGRLNPSHFGLSHSVGPDILEVQLSYREGMGSLTFLGVNHISPPQPAFFARLTEIVARTQPTRIYLEVDDVSYIASLPQDVDEVIRTRGEPSYLGFIARREGIALRPMEPRPEQLYLAVRQSFSAEQVLIARVLREVQIMRDRSRLFGERLEQFTTAAIQQQRQLMTPDERASAPSNIFEFTMAVSRLWPGLDWRQVPAEWSNPLLNSEQTGSRFVNAVFTAETRIRDEHALAILLQDVVNGHRLLAMAGRTHAETQLRTLTCLNAPS